MILTAAELKEYNQAHDDSTLNDLFISAAQDIIENFLGYGVEETFYVDRLYSGDGTCILFLGKQPISAVDSVKIDGAVMPGLDELKVQDDYIYHEDGFPAGIQNISVTFTAGWAAGEIPNVIKLTALRIAGILKKESNGNIGINSVTDPASGSRTFQEIRFGKYLSLLAKYRINYQDR